MFEQATIFTLTSYARVLRDKWQETEAGYVIIKCVTMSIRGWVEDLVTKHHSTASNFLMTKYDSTQMIL